MTEEPNILENFFPVADEGQLSVDVIETNDKVIVRSTIAGVKPEDLDVHIARDMITIRGTRQEQKEDIGSTYHFRECYWGGFSRTVVLPAHITPDKAKAELKNGILTITLPKAHIETKIPIRFKDDEED